MFLRQSLKKIKWIPLTLESNKNSKDWFFFWKWLNFLEKWFDYIVNSTFFKINTIDRISTYDDYSIIIGVVLYYQIKILIKFFMWRKFGLHTINVKIQH